MEGETERIGSKVNPQRQPVVLPDGSQPQLLGSGSITALVGSGAMSNVYKIWNPQMESQRAVKLMKPDLSLETQRRFQTEIKIMAALSHPNIIKIHSVGEWNSLPYIEMEFIDGFTLSEIIAKKGAMPIPVCLALGIMMARALVYAHTKEYVLFGNNYKGIIHRDLKPSNIMVGKDGHVTLMDFGIARPVETSLMTLDGAVMGTMQYLAPEQIDGKNVGVTADLYSLGAVLYEALTGKKAFPQKNLSQLMSFKSENNFVPLRLFKVKIPGRLKSLVDKCMMHKQEKRPQSALVTLKGLENILKRTTTDSPEAILGSFMQSPIDIKTELFVRKRIPVAAILITVLSVAAILAGARFLFFMTERAAAPAQKTSVVPAEKKDTPLPPPPSVAPAAKPRYRQPIAVAQKPLPPAVAVIETVRVQSPQPVSTAPVSYLDEMKSKHGLQNPVELMAKEAGLGNYKSVLKIFNELSPQEQESDRSRLFRLRALYALGNNDEMTAFFKTPVIEDGEYYLIKAKYLLNRGSVDQTVALLEKGVATGTRLIDAETLRRDYLYYRALCFSRFFRRSPSDETRKAALDSWFEVKNFLRRFPGHEYYLKAVAEMQSLAAQDAGNKGGGQ